MEVFNKMKHVKGDLITLARTGQFDLIIHGCNCFCTMGAGIAKLIRDNFPRAYLADLKTGMGDQQKLGTYSSALIVYHDKSFTVVNAYTQFNFSGNGVLADYAAIQKVFTTIKQDFGGLRIGYPKIGAGLAGGDWQIISGIIDTALSGEDHTLVEYVP